MIQSLYNIQEDHSGNYIDGQMDNESSPKGFYIVFDKTNYGIDQSKVYKDDE